MGSGCWLPPAAKSRHKSCQRRMCGQLLLPLRTKKRGTAWSCDKEDAYGQQLLVAASSKEQTPKVPKEDVWTLCHLRKHLNSPPAGDTWASLATADKGHGEPCPLPRQENQRLLSASLAVARGFLLICPWTGRLHQARPSKCI